MDRGLRLPDGLVPMIDFTNPQIWWFLSRATGMVAWVLMTITVVWGVLLKTRILRGVDNPEWLKATHRYISGLAVVMIVAHVGTLLLDEYISFGLADVLIPFHTSFEPLAIALGIFALYAVFAVQITALASAWLPDAVWRSIHLLSYVAVILVAVHSGMVGTDVGTPWYTIISLIVITTTTLAGVVRILIAGRRTPQREPVSPQEQSQAPLAEEFNARVVGRTQVGDSIAVFTLSPVDSDTPLEWDAGAHITLKLPTGLERQYSLAGDPADQTVLTIAVLDTRGEGGGSSWIHENLNVGDTLTCGLPANHFPLKPAKKYQFVASGIGVTPLRSMLFSLPAHRDWSLLYLGRKRSEMAFVDELVAHFGERIEVWASEEKGGRANLGKLVDPTAEIYACGSESVLSELEDLVPPRRLHVERFSPAERKPAGGFQAFTVIAQRSGLTIPVSADSTMLGALESSGISLPASCRRGVCGGCEVAVLSGKPEHLDSVMSDADKDELAVMYPCVSRAWGESITVDA